MKLIYAGSHKRSELYSEITKETRKSLICLIGIGILLLFVPIIFKSKIFMDTSGMSNVVLLETDSGTGSAIFIGNNKLLTAAHVLTNMSVGNTCSITFQDPNDPNRFVYAQAEIIHKGKHIEKNQSLTNCLEDYALMDIIGITASKYAKPCNIASSQKVKVGDNIAVEGYPNGNYFKTEGTVNNISGGSLKDNNFFVVSAGAWGGNSGGALLDTNGNLIGIVTMGGVSVGVNDGQTFVLKIDYIKDVLAKFGFQIY